MWETLGNVGKDLGGALWGGISNVGDYALGTGGGATAGLGNSPLWGQSLMGDLGALLGSEAGQNALGVGLQGYNIYQQGQFNKAAQDVMDRQLGMQEEAWQQNQQANQNRQNLNF